MKTNKLFVILILISCSIQHTFGQSMTKLEADQGLRYRYQEINKQCPIIVDSQSTIINTRYENQTIIYTQKLGSSFLFEGKNATLYQEYYRMHLINGLTNVVSNKDEFSTALSVIKPTFQINIVAGPYKKTYRIKYSEVIEAKKTIDNGGVYLKPMRKWMIDKQLINATKERIDSTLYGFEKGVKKFLPIEIGYGLTLSNVYFSIYTREIVFKSIIEDDVVGTSLEQPAMEGILKVISVIDYPIIAVSRKGNYHFRFVTIYHNSGRSFREIAFDADEMESLYDFFQRENNKDE